MNALLRFSLCAGAGLLLWVALTRTHPRLVGELVPGVCCLPEAWAQLVEEAERSQDLEDARAAVEGRVQAKAAIAEDLVAGRLTLLQAAARFRDLNSRPPRFHWDRFRLAYPGTTDDERHCYEVLAAAQAFAGSLKRRPPNPLLDRLEQELRQHLQNGTVQLGD
jgi:hypothetical protein